MNISFDLDSTIIPNGDEFETEKRNIVIRLLGAEKIRKGTFALFTELKARGHKIHIYTTSFRPTFNIRKSLICYGIRVDRIINQDQNKKTLKLLVDWVQDSFMHNIREVNKVICMFLNHHRGVINALISTHSNAMAERLNGKIQEIKTVGRGYRKFKNFRSTILFFCGGLDLYPLKW